MPELQKKSDLAYPIYGNECINPKRYCYKKEYMFYTCVAFD